MTPRAYLDAVRKRCEAATAGPWVSLSLGVKAERAAAIGRTTVAATHNQERIYARVDGGTNPNSDARFIASARTDLPKLERIARLAEDYREARSDAARDALFAALEELK